MDLVVPSRLVGRAAHVEKVGGGFTNAGHGDDRTEVAEIVAKTSAGASRSGEDSIAFTTDRRPRDTHVISLAGDPGDVQIGFCVVGIGAGQVLLQVGEAITVEIGIGAVVSGGVERIESIGLLVTVSSPLKNGLIPQAMETTGDRSCAAPTNAEC